MRKSLAVCLFAWGCGTVADSPSGEPARIRVAHVSPGAPAVDFCLAAHGTTAFTGPILAGAGRAAGLSYATVTRYFDVDAARYDVRLVAPGAANCSQPLAGLDDFTRLPELAAGGAYTVAAEGTLGGTGDAAFTLRGYADDTEVESGRARLRLIHASPGTPAVDAGVGGGVAFTKVFDDVAFGEANAVATAPLAGARISARPHGSASDVLAIDGASLPDGAIATVFAIGQLGSADAPLRALLCVDNAEPNGVHAACSVVGDAPHNARLRIAHLSPDAPAVDVCVARAGQPFGAPLLRSLGAKGLAYPQVTAYVELPPARYDVRVVHASAAGCATAAIPDTKGLDVAADLTATVAAIGDLEPSGADPALRLAVLVDATAVAAGKTKLRVVHASPSTPAVDVGVGTGAGFQKLFSGIAFGKVGVHPPLEDGYLEAAPVAAAVTARVAGTSADALSIPHATFDAGAIATVFAVGGKTGQATNPLRFLVCRDSHPADGLLASCAIAP